eukprot:371405_1
MTVATNAMHLIQILTGIDDILKTYLQHPNITLTQHKCTMHTSNYYKDTMHTSVACCDTARVASTTCICYPCTSSNYQTMRKNRAYPIKFYHISRAHAKACG